DLGVDRALPPGQFLEGHGGERQIRDVGGDAIVERGFGVEPAPGELHQRLGAHDDGRRALDHGDLGGARFHQVGVDVVGGGGGADDDAFLAAVGGAGGE